MRFLLILARSAIGGAILGWVLAHLSFILPVRRLRETQTLLAFHHPQPSYPVHILLVPKQSLRRFTDLTAADSALISEIIQTAHSLIAEFNLERSGYRLIVNGGDYQEVPQLYFHLISERETHPAG
jgi:histidine triad (HIT) family protein